ncbi:MAG: hypothetical protein A4E45_01214 [Methanosaeta sp. PtaB.Bin039]|nr:MAG: hypothetical protein A4E45_01214 [Methanosaeta sp. PtaB.Bin039]OPY47392.1 MAG: hypothetical protein A4E47_00301 [Methanosaeta sp. PtaU1.Bin028]HOT07121.1 hypothetical protein [Methanotrichaceae archaeon]HQF17065.1 hypothetical protein [Methanotrichaceae archaeon]HQI91686.1 hypothetical protein [Methanotrichaceae archaeon]
MRPCVVGIGGAGCNVLRKFLESQDVDLKVHSFGQHLAFGDVKGVWLDSASQDAQNQNFYGSLAEGCYPGYLICHDLVPDGSPSRDYIQSVYGFDLKAMGYDRRAEYLKGIFEIFEYDLDLKKMTREEFSGEENPLSGYVWKEGIRPLTTLSRRAGKGNKNNVGNGEDPSALSGMQWLWHDIAPKSNGHDSRLCDSILFIASLGGGTGTGFINPITSYVRSEELAFPIFALGVLTERGSDSRHASEGQRCLGATIAMYDLLTKEAGTGIDGLLLVDNQVLSERYDRNYSRMDEAIYRSLKPLLDLRHYPGSSLQDDAPAMRRVFWETDGESANLADAGGLLPPLLVPCYAAGRPDGQVQSLVDRALSKDGRLFPCDPARAERAYVLSRGFFSSEELISATAKRTGLPRHEIKVYRKLGDRMEDLLILLRNPYGGSAGACREEGTLESRLHQVIGEAIRYIEENETDIIEYLGYSDLTKEHLREYLYGQGGLKDELGLSLARLEGGEKHPFRRPMSMFGIGDLRSFRSVREACTPQATERAALEEIVRSQLEQILSSDEGAARIKRLIGS